MTNIYASTLATKLNRIPPCIARIMAKKDGRLMKDLEICSATGWSLKKVGYISTSTSWDNIKVCDVDAFLTACGLRWSTQRRQRWLLQIAFERGGFDAVKNMRHLKRAGAAQLSKHIKRIERLFSKT